MRPATWGSRPRKTYDIEVWLPGQGHLPRDLLAAATAEAYQAQAHANIALPAGPPRSGRPRFAHTLNGSALAVGRTLVAVLEAYQQEGGSVAVPEALRPYMGGLEAIG